MRVSAMSALLVVLLSGCASHPDDIAPESVSAEPYKELSCDALGEELTRSKEALAEASKRQKDKRTTDGVGNVLLLPGLLSLAKDSSEAVAFYKGEVATLTRELDLRGCEKEEQDAAQAGQAEGDPAEVDQAEADQAEADQAEADQAEVDQAEVDQAEVDQSVVEDGANSSQN